MMKSSILLTLCAVTIFAMQSPVKVHEYEVRDLRIKKHYYFSLLPADVKNLLRKYHAFPTDAQVDKAFKYHNLNAIEFCASIAKQYVVDDHFYGDGFFRGYPRIAQLFLDLGGNPNGHHTSWGRPLYVAAGAGHAHIVRLLLDAGAQPDYKPARLLLPLQVAARNGHAQVVRLLLAAGADPNSKRYGYEDETALALASKEGCVEVVQVLLEMGVNCIVTPKKHTNSPLYYAARQNYIQVARLLIAHGADVNHLVWNYPGDGSALAVAALNGHLDMVKLLLAAGADPDNESNPIVNCLEKSRATNMEQVLHALVQKSKRKDEYTQYIVRVLHRRGMGGTLFKMNEK